MTWQRENGIATRNGSSGEIYDRQPPHDLDSEAGALSAILSKPEAIAVVTAAGIDASDFYDEANRTIFAAMQRIVAHGALVDVALLLPMLRDNSDLGDRAPAALAKLVQSPGLPANLPHYIERVLDASHRRKLALTLDQLRIDVAGSRPTIALLDSATRQIEDLRIGTSAAGKVPTYQRLTSIELDKAHFEQEYLIDGALVAGQPCIIAGGKKTLKTNIIIDLAISLATASPWLGNLRVNRRARVALMSGESGLATIQETARRICDSKRLSLRDVDGVVWSSDLPIASDLSHEPALQEFLRANEIEVLVIDPAYLSLPGADAGNLFVQGAMLRRLAEVCRSAGAMLVLVHHTRKGTVDPFQPPELEDIAWAGFQEFCRQWILVGRREKYEPGTGRHRLWLNIGGSAGHSALWALNIAEGVYDGRAPRRWEVELVPAKDARQDAKQRRESEKLQQRQEKNRAQLDGDKAAIIRTVGSFPEGETKSGIRDGSGVRSDRFNAALAELLAEKAIVATTIIKGKNQRYEGYKLRPDSDENGTLGHTRTEHPDNLSDSGGTLGTDTLPVRECPTDCVSPAQFQELGADA